MIGKLVSGLILITVLGVSLYLSPLRGNTVAVVGVFASLSAVIIALLATTEIEILTAEEENTSMDKTSLEGTYAYDIVNDTVRRLDFSQTNMCLRKTNEFKMDVYSSESQITLSSRYAPRRAHLVKRPHKRDKSDDMRGRAYHKEGRKEGKIRDGSRNRFNPAKPIPT
ncbi:MAG: hypothetical protein ACE5J6_04435 [Candidatus Bathyarchaeia archaeon]